jgi:hypothetical protein
VRLGCDCHPAPEHSLYRLDPQRAMENRAVMPGTDVNDAPPLSPAESVA